MRQGLVEPRNRSDPSGFDGSAQAGILGSLTVVIAVDDDDGTLFVRQELDCTRRGVLRAFHDQGTLGVVRIRVAQPVILRRTLSIVVSSGEGSRREDTKHNRNQQI